MTKRSSSPKISFRKLARWGGALAAAVLFLLVFTAAVEVQKRVSCNDIKVKVDYENGIFFIHEEDILREVCVQDNDSIIGQPLTEVNLAALEQQLHRNPFAANIELYADIRGNLNIEVEQRQPLLRVIHNVNYYIDKKGKLMPVSPKFTARVPVVTGIARPVPENGSVAEDSLLAAIYQLGVFVEADPFWKAQIAQIHFNENEEVELFTRLGSQTIVLGEVDRLNDKFARLMRFYKAALPVVGWDKYHLVNLKYDNQIICKKY